MRAAAGMPCSVSTMKMVGHMKMKMQRAAQERECGIGEAHNETDKIKSFPVHSFTSLELTWLNLTSFITLRLSPGRSSAAADAAHATTFPPAPAFLKSLPSGPGSCANLCAWPD